MFDQGMNGGITRNHEAVHEAPLCAPVSNKDPKLPKCENSLLFRIPFPFNLSLLSHSLFVPLPLSP